MSCRESEIQQSCVRWFRYQYPQYAKQLIAVPNAAKRTTKVVCSKLGSKVICVGGKRAKDEGLVAGVADMLLLLSRGEYGSLCLEFKTEKGRQSTEQREWQKSTEEAGNKYCLIRCFDDFKNIVEAYLISN